MDFRKDLEELFETFSWNIKGFIDTEGNIYPIPTIPQVITGIFEALTVPKIKELIRRKYKCTMEQGNPREYPQITAYGGDISEGKIAIDIKTTRRTRKDRVSRFSLGSHGSYFRKPDKKLAGCRYPYGDYREHWIVGFIYTWEPDQRSEKMVSDVEVIVEEKWRIASKQTATGDTAAIGSVKEIERLRSGEGDFSSNKEFEEYWRLREVRRS